MYIPKNLPDMSNQDFDGIILTGLNLSYGSLQNSSFKKAKMDHMWLCGANLKDADLTGVDMTGSDLTGADLSGAKMTGIKLSGTIIVGASFRGADWGI